MAPDIRLSHVILTSEKAHPQFPAAIESVEQAIDYLQELPPPLLRMPHWRAASLALWSVLDSPQDAERMATAEAALCGALAAEGWRSECGLN